MFTLGGLNAAPLEFSVTETVGLRRFSYPVTASLKVPCRALPEAATARLIGPSGKEQAAQFTAMANWPDGSVRQLDVDLVSSVGPNESEKYRVELTGGTPLPHGRNSLGVTESADEITVASPAIAHRIRRDGRPLLTSVTNAKIEYIGRRGVSTILPPGKLEVPKRGPFNVTLRLGALTLEYVNSKSWVKITQRAGAPRELTVRGQFALTEAPVMWDLGLEGWLYGLCKQTNSVAVLCREADGWAARTGIGKALTVFAAGKRCEGWGHFADKQRVVAFGISDFSADGNPRVSLRGDGEFEVVARRNELTAYFHFVPQPINVTAMTSPQAMIAPLSVKR
jgi:hypothetical protein